MICSEEYGGVKERQCQSAHCTQWGLLPSWTRTAPEAGWSTTFEQLGSATNEEYILHLVGSVYKGHSSVGQSRLQPVTVKHVTAKIKEGLKEHVRSHRVSQAPTRHQSTVHCTVWLWLNPHRGLKVLLHRVLVNPRAKGTGHWAGGNGCQARHTGSRAKDPTPKAVDTILRTGDRWIVMNMPYTMAALAQWMSAKWTEVGEGVRVPRNVASAYRSRTQRLMI